MYEYFFILIGGNINSMYNLPYIFHAQIHKSIEGCIIKMVFQKSK